jgi:hypothetical protein
MGGNDENGLRRGGQQVLHSAQKIFCLLKNLFALTRHEKRRSTPVRDVHGWHA